MGFFSKKKKKKDLEKERQVEFILGHFVMLLSNHVDSLDSTTDQKDDLYKLYIKTLYDCMDINSKLLFNKAILSANDALDKLKNGATHNQVQIQRQLNDIFKMAGKE